MRTDCLYSGSSEAKGDLRAKSATQTHMHALIYYLYPTPLVVPAVYRFCKLSRKTLFPKVIVGLTELDLNSL